MLARALVPLLLFVACGGGSSHAPPQRVVAAGGTGAASQPDDTVGSGDPRATPDMLTSSGVRAFVDGVPLGNAPALQAWLEQLGDAVVKLPILLDYDGIGYANPRVAGSSLALSLDDSALGVGLADRVRVAGNSAGQTWLPTVGIWLEGTWRNSTLRIDRAGTAGPPSDLAGATHALVQARP
jgi:hypothetical protein